MNFDTLKMPMAQIYYLANTPTYIYRNIVSEFANMNLQSVLEADLDVWENSISVEDTYLLYLAIYIRIINEYKFDEAKYKNLKWHEEFISYCRAKQTSTIIEKDDRTSPSKMPCVLELNSPYTAQEVPKFCETPYQIVNVSQEVTINAQD